MSNHNNKSEIEYLIWPCFIARILKGLTRIFKNEIFIFIWFAKEQEFRFSVSKFTVF